MGLFSRKRVAKRLDVTPARVSQMAASGAMIEPIEDEDGTERGWPATYVEEVAGQRQGRRTSRSIWGYPPRETAPVRIGDVVVAGPGDREAFVQLLDVDAGRIGLVTLLQPTIKRVLPFMDSLARDDEPFTTYGPDLLPFIQSASNALSVDPYDVAWIRVGRLYAEEVVVVSEPSLPQPAPRFSGAVTDPGRTETAQQERVSWSVLHTKIGAPVPILDVRTLEAVEAWQSAGRTRADVVFDTDSYLNRAMSAVLLAHLVSSDGDSLSGDTSTARSRALRLALSRLETTIDWSQSGTQVESFLASSEPDHVDLLTRTVHPGFETLRSQLADGLLEDVMVPSADLQAAADILGRLIHETYGRFGSTPDPSVAFALDQGVLALIRGLPGEPGRFHDEVRYPVFYELRDFQAAPGPGSRWTEYLSSLTPAPDLDSPAARILFSKMNELYSHERQAAASQIMVDKDENHVLVQHVARFEGEQITRVTVVVPVAPLSTRQLHHLKAFDEIVIEPDTQNGPVLLTVDGELHVMPFGSQHPGRFTYGYNGHGPGNLASALIAFLEWVQGASMTPEGKNRVEGIVVTADQWRELRVSRGQIFKPGTFLPESTQ